MSADRSGPWTIATRQLKLRQVKRAGFPSYKVEQSLIAEWLREEPGHDGLLDTLTRPRVVMGRDENRRDY